VHFFKIIIIQHFVTIWTMKSYFQTMYIFFF